MLSSKPTKSFQPGDRVIFTLRRRSTRPRPGAKDVRPEPRGEGYFDFVDNLWLVAQTRGTQVVVKTAHGRIHVLQIADPRLRPASWWQRLIYRHRFPKPDPIAPRPTLLGPDLSRPSRQNNGIAHV